MKNTSHKMTTKIVAEVTIESITCDCCGKTEHGKHVELSSDIETQTIDFGYGSSLDGDVYKIDVCTDCVIKWFETFKHKPKPYSSMHIDDDVE